MYKEFFATQQCKNQTTQIEKWVKDKRYFTKKDIKMAEKYMKSC